MPWQHPTTTPPLCGICAQPASAHDITIIENRWWAFCTRDRLLISDLMNHQQLLADEANGAPRP